MRILLVSDDPADGKAGAVKVPHKLATALRAAGHHCDLLFSDELGTWPQNRRWRETVGPWLAWRAALRQWRTQGPYDVIDAASAEGWLIAWARRWGQFPGAAVVARSHGLEHIFYRELLHDHDAGHLRKPWWRRCWYPLIRLSQVAMNIRLADRTILLNRRARAVVVRHRWTPSQSIAIVPHGVDAARWTAAPASGAERGAGALFVGAWYPMKGAPYLAQAHRRLIRQGIHLPLTIMGGAPGAGDEVNDRYVRASFAAESQPWLTVLRWQTDEDAVFACYRRHDFLVCPSTAEGFGLVVLEALSQRLPVICTTAVGAADRLRPGQDALIVPPRDAKALAGAMSRLWQSADLRRSLGDSGHERMRDCSWRHAADVTLEAYATARVAAAAGAK